jgi:predicted PurR-regulated permease PerM
LFLVKLSTNIWRILGVLVIILFIFLFFKIVVYLGISLILFLLGYPISYRLSHFKVMGRHLPAAISSLITLAIFSGVVFVLFIVIVPPLANQIHFISTLNFGDVMNGILEQYPGIKRLLLRFGDVNELKATIAEQLRVYVNASNISLVVSDIFAYSGAIVGGTLCVLFITFFLLKDEHLVKESILLLSPSGYETSVSEIVRTTKDMLSSYFTALFSDMFIVGGSVMVALSLQGIENALIIAFCAGLLNMIPYIGSFITMIIAVTLGASSCISAGHYHLIGHVINTIFFTLLIINLIDAFIIQPLIFSNSVKAHPLEIFLVTLMAGTIGGVLGMIVALPAYTLIRIVSREFLRHLKFFRKISDAITPEQVNEL